MRAKFTGIIAQQPLWLNMKEKQREVAILTNVNSFSACFFPAASVLVPAAVGRPG